MTRKEIAAEIDQAIGARLRLMRDARGVTQSELGDAIGVTFQQIQKYEKGTNRVSISTLKMMCKVLHCKPMDIIGEDDDAPVSATPPLDLVATSTKQRRALQAIARIIQSAGLDASDIAFAPAEDRAAHAAQTH